MLLVTKPNMTGLRLLQSFARGCEEHGDTVSWSANGADAANRIADADVAVQICTANPGDKISPISKFRHSVKANFDAIKKRIVVIDSGFIQKSREDERTFSGVDPEHYWQVGYDGLKREADYCNGDLGGEPLRFLSLGVEPKEFHGNRDAAIAIIGQTSGGNSAPHTDIYKWYSKVVKEIRKSTDKRILIRQHPRISRHRINSAADRSAIFKAVGSPDHLDYNVIGSGHIEDWVKDISAAVAFSSNGGVTTALHGIPTYVCSYLSMAYDVRAGDLADFSRPSVRDANFEHWRNSLAYAQWNEKEMLSGECWNHLRPHAVRTSD